jgi:hypothetical protein
MRTLSLGQSKAEVQLFCFASDDWKQRACWQGRDDRYAWPSDNRVIEVAAVPRSGPWPRNT